MRKFKAGKLMGVVAVMAVIAYAALAGLTGSMNFDVSVQAQEAGNVPGRTLGNMSDSDVWRQVRRGAAGKVSIPDLKSAVLINAEGNTWRAARNGPISQFGGWGMLAIIVVISVFFAVRGQIKIEGGRSGVSILRFNLIERTAHWIAAISFVVLALTGLNILYGRYFFIPVIGQDAFAAITSVGKFVHDWVGYAFGVGVVMIIVLWLKDNIPNALDIKWLAKFGGLFSQHPDVPAKKFNAGQKIIYWSVAFGGISLFATGLSLLFPFEIGLFAKTFLVLNIFGADLPTALSPLQETQLALLWHSIVALIMTVIMIGHIYIGTVGMEGAFDAMYSGEVDMNWAKEHHSLWVEETEGEGGSKTGNPAE